MTNDIASELAHLHTLKGSAYVNQLKAIAGRKEFHPLVDDPDIFGLSRKTLSVTRDLTLSSDFYRIFMRRYVK